VPHSIQKSNAQKVARRPARVYDESGMGIRDRDYMKRPSDDEASRGSSAESKAEDFLSKFVQKHPRFFLYVAIGFAVLIVISLVVVHFSGANR